jgi:hypothetical protein
MSHYCPGVAEDDRDYRFVFSTIRPLPRLVFQYSARQGPAAAPDSPGHAVRHSGASAGQPAPLELSRGVLTLEYCGQLLADLLRAPQLHPFRQKISAELLPDYHAIVKRPMDLRTLQERLCAGHIATVAQFRAELNLIWENCVQYNGRSHPLGAAALEAQRALAEVFRRCEAPPPSHALAKLLELRDALDRAHADAAALLRVPPRPFVPPAKKPPKAPPRAPPPPPRPADAVPNHQQRKVIADKLSRAPPREMRRAWELLRPFVDASARERQALSLNALPDPVLVELKRVVLS